MDDTCELDMEYWGSVGTEGMDREIQRANARMRHFRGVAASVMSDAQTLWKEIWDSLQDTRSVEEILDDVGGHPPTGDPEPLLDKLHRLGVLIDYARRLCDGSIENGYHSQGEDGP